MRSDQRGVALVVAVFVLTVVGALVAAAFFAGLQEHRMSDSTRRYYRAMAAAETQIAEVLRQWPDTDGTLEPYPNDSLVIMRGSVILRRLGVDLHMVAVPEYALGMLVFRAESCLADRVDGVEMTQAKCYNDSTLQKMAAPTALRSRAWLHLF